ncbi:MAG: biopolymer transporter ExbD [Acidiphilium sp. 34-60-192]|nr:MAG: biopolymer transporter ExbD [Acidiphilium sp. 34-60-192]
MAMNMRGGQSDDPGEMVDINTTPLIDVMLVLLTMLIITIPVQLHAVNLNLPHGHPPPPPTPPPVVQIDINYDGTLEVKLKAAANEVDQPEIHVNPNKLANYSSVISVMAAAEHDGLTKIGIVGNEQYSQ